MERLLHQDSISDPNEFHLQCQRFAEKKQVTVVLKGGPTFVFHPNTTPLIITHGSPALATAGTGDVLTGVIAAFLAEGLDPRAAAVMGASMHGLAGEIAASEKTPYCVVASDVIEALPEAFHIFL
jgi:NAD(P)H-hydrate epimerase